MADNFFLEEVENMQQATSWCSDLLSNGGELLAMAEKSIELAGEPEDVNLTTEFLEIDSIMKDVSAPFLLEIVQDDVKDVTSPTTDIAASPVSQLNNQMLLDDLVPGSGPEQAAKQKKVSKKSKASAVTKTIVKDSEDTALRVKPAQFCHVCWRSTKRVDVAICSNISRSACRKVICQKCFVKFGWDWESASSPNGTWTCTHCCGTCPAKAQCYVYGKTNERRRKQRAALKANAL